MLVEEPPPGRLLTGFVPEFARGSVVLGRAEGALLPPCQSGAPLREDVVPLGRVGSTLPPVPTPLTPLVAGLADVPLPAVGVGNELGFADGTGGLPLLCCDADWLTSPGTTASGWVWDIAE